MTLFAMESQKWSTYDANTEVALASLSDITGENIAVQIKKNLILNGKPLYELSFCETIPLQGGAAEVGDLYDLEAMFAIVGGSPTNFPKIDNCIAGYFDEENAENALIVMLLVGNANFKPEPEKEIAQMVLNMASGGIVGAEFTKQANKSWSPKLI